LSWHEERVKIIRNASVNEGKPVSIILDLQGPRIRTGLLKDGKPIRLKPGNVVTITTRDIYGKEGLIATSYKALPGEVKGGDKILLDDGTMELKVLGSSRHDVKCEVITGGLLKEHKGMNLPDVKLSASSLTELDKKNLSHGLKWGIDYIAISFVRSARDVKSVKDFIKKKGYSIPIIAKIEKPEAVEDINSILVEAEGVMVARGDLGVEMEPQRVPLIQKDIIKKANKMGKVVITATQMLESMISNPRPTRAEASDVANAILDGTDAVMLSGETSVGKYPIEAVKMMSKIAYETEKGLDVSSKLIYRKGSTFSEAIAHAALDAAMATDAKAIIAYTISGRTAQLLSKLKPQCPILALTSEQVVYCRLPIFWGVEPVLIPFGNSTDEMLNVGERAMIKKRFLKRGDVVVIVSGTSPTLGATNMMKVHRIGE
jgi:pyruvate kinase